MPIPGKHIALQIRLDATAYQYRKRPDDKCCDDGILASGHWKEGLQCPETVSLKRVQLATFCRHQLAALVDSVSQLQQQQLSTAHQPELVASVFAEFASYKATTDTKPAGYQLTMAALQVNKPASVFCLCALAGMCVSLCKHEQSTETGVKQMWLKQHHAGPAGVCALAGSRAGSAAGAEEEDKRRQAEEEAQHKWRMACLPVCSVHHGI